MIELSSQQIEDLAEKLVSTLDFNDLQKYVYVATGKALYEYWVNKEPLSDMMLQLLVRLQKQGEMVFFLSKVYIERPHRKDIREFIATLYPDAVLITAPEYNIQKRGAFDEDASISQLTAPGLQKNIKPHLHQIDILQWVDGLLKAKSRTCRIEFGGNAAGTGFLVGPEAVLTNWHVVEAAHKVSRTGDLACRFDYNLEKGGARNTGIAIQLHEDGVVHHRPYSQAELTDTPDFPPPSAAELDFALLRLASPIGNDDQPGGRRGWITLPEFVKALDIGSPLIIVQHPDGGPIKMAIDTEAILPVPEPSDRPRIRYATNTAPGSSGSPCFTMEWDLVALHHFGDPAWRQPKFNQGVPTDLIRADIFRANHSGLLGGSLEF